MIVKRYKKIINLKKKYHFSDFEIATNYGLFSGDTNLFKTLKIFELLMQTKNLKGDIIEFGIHKGNTSLLIGKIIKIFKLKKKLYLVDHFKGLINFSKNDPKKSVKYKKYYKGNKKQIQDFLKFNNLKKVKIMDIDASKIKNNYFKNWKFSLVYFDMDLYLPTKNSLNTISKNIVKNGIIVFDQANKNFWGEKKAAKEFLANNENYKVIFKEKYYQPDLVIKKIKN